MDNLEATDSCDRCGEMMDSDADACMACGTLRTGQPCAVHADRDARGICVVCGTAVCADCNHGGSSHYLCATHGEIQVVAGWAQVYSTPNDLEAQLLRENLEAEGIDARVLSQKDHFSLPVELGDLSQVRVLVPAFAYSEAETLISEHMDADGELRFGDDGQDQSSHSG